MGELYDRDILEWSEKQAALLRRVGAGEQVNDLVDWENVAEEVESVGRGQLAQVKSLLVQALAHMLQAEAWPSSSEVPHWQAEARGFRGDAADIFAPSMRHKIDMADLYRRALRRRLSGNRRRPSALSACENLYSVPGLF